MPRLSDNVVTIPARDFEGLQPAIDSRRVAKPYVSAGRNFLFDIDGPKSGFGGVYLSEQQFWNPAHHQTIQVGNEVWHFNQRSIMRYNPLSNTYDTLMVHQDTSNIPYRWTSALIVDKLFFAHPAVGLIYWDLELRRLFRVSSPYLPGTIYGVCASYGRLCALGRTHLYWSAQDDGLDFAPSLQTGAGAQALSIVGGDGLTLAPYGGGVITFTKGRAMRTEFTADIVVFRHRPLRVGEEKTNLVNSFCVVTLDSDEIVFMDETGLFSTRGDTPQEWQPIFNEFLRKELKNVDVNNGRSVRMEYDRQNKRLYVSLSYDETRPLFQKSYVLHIPTGRFGVFNRPHYAICGVTVTKGKKRGRNFGAVLKDKRFFLFDEDLESAESPNTDTGHNWFVPKRKHLTYQDSNGVTVMPSSMRIRTGVDEYDLELANKPCGYYDNTGEFKRPMPQSGLDSAILLGLFRWTEARYDDELSLITDLHIGNGEIGDTDLVPVDMDSLSGNYDMGEDFGGEDTEVDMGVSAYDVSTYRTTIESSLDGATEWNACDASVKLETRRTNYFTAYTLGLYHRVIISAQDAGEYFYIKDVELSGASAGRL